MTKAEFLARLQKGLSVLPQEDIDERIYFYSEMIDDRTEDGLSEEEAVAEIGNPQEIIEQIIADVPISKLVIKKIKPKKRLGAWEITLLVLGSPIWLSLMIAAFAVVLSLYISLWAVIFSFWAVFVALLATAIGLAFGGIYFAFCGHALTGVAIIGTGLFCAGLSVFFFLLCKMITRGSIYLTKRMVFSFVKRGKNSEK